MRWMVQFVLPPILLGLHLLIMSLLGEEGRSWFTSELGPGENATFAVCLAAGVWAIVLWRRFRKVIPRVRWLLLAFGVACIFVAMEEISHGQHYLGYATPEWAASLNKQGEFNLHNLGRDHFSRVSRRIAEIGLPVFGIILPFVLARFPAAYRPSDWTYYLMPKYELMVVLAMGLLVRINHEMDDALFSEALSHGLGELQELYWALAGLIWISTISRRLHQLPPAAAVGAG